MSEIGKYIYGIISSNGEKFFGPCGITAWEEVYTISYHDISAVVSDSEIVDYTHMSKDDLAKLLVRHQQVIERIISLEYSIIPMRLGSYIVDGDEVRHILAKGYPIIKDIFNKIGDKIEIDIVATWSDFASALKEVGEEREIKEFKERLLANHKGITADDQMKVGVMVKRALDEKREKYAFQIQNALKTVSKDFKVHEVMDDKMVINTAFLINKARCEDFDRKVRDLNTKFAEKLNFRCVGPLPPYSFYTLEIKKIQFEEIDWARKKLGLNGLTTNKEEIKKAYQKSAFSSHPDKNPDIPGIEKEFNDVTKAYKVLLEYCQDDTCSFKEEDFRKDSLIVKVRE